MSASDLAEHELVPLRARARSPRRVVFLTGAGISRAAGLPTYRGPDGLWEKDPQLAASLVAGASPDLLWSKVASMRPAIVAAAPTIAHRAVAGFEAAMRAIGGEVTVITQNVDGLHTRAGSVDVIEYHGALLRTRCADRRCGLPPYEDASSPTVAPVCPRCGGPLRPDVVLFDESIGVREEHRAKRALDACDYFIAVGTSGLVWPAASFVRSAAYAGATTIDVNVVGQDDSPFDETLLGPADDVLTRLLE